MYLLLFIQSVTWGGGGIGLYGEHIQELYIHCVFVRTYKIALAPQTKNLGRERPQTDKHLQLSPFTCHFLKKSRYLGLESISYLVHATRNAYQIQPHRQITDNRRTQSSRQTTVNRKNSHCRLVPYSRQSTRHRRRLSTRLSLQSIPRR